MLRKGSEGVPGGRPELGLEAELQSLRQRQERLTLENERLVEAQRLLEDACLRYGDLYDYAPLAYVTLDSAGVMREINLVAAALLGGDRKTLMGLPLQRFVADVDREALTRHLARCRKAEGTITCELRIASSGDTVPVQLWSRTSARTADRFPSALVDLRERERAADERRRLLASERAAREASEAKDKFIAMLSHELRTPLTPVLAAVSAARERGDLAPEHRALFEMIHRNVAAESRLIDDLLDVTRIVRGKMRLERAPVDLHQVARDAVEVTRGAAREKRLTLDVDLGAQRHHTHADPGRLRQVLWNLLSNAVKFTPEGGHITLRSWNEGETLAIEVGDSGVGFDEDAQARLFQPFSQPIDHEAGGRPAGGLGLGLAIAKGIVELHEGRISAASAGPGGGARFLIELGLLDDVAPAPGAAANPPSGTHRARPRILLVEDHPDTAATLSELLIERGHEVHVATSIKTALAVDLAGIDLVVSDLGLPDGSGLELIRKLQVRRRTAAIALSGYATESDIRACREAGFDLHLAKPLDFDRLIQAIRQVTGGG